MVSLKKHFKNNGVTYNEKQRIFVMKFINLNLMELIRSLTSNIRKMKVNANANVLKIKMYNDETAEEFAAILRSLEILKD